MRADMKSMVWKELRENFRWALLAFVGMGIAMAAALAPHFRGFRLISLNTRSIMSPDFQFVTMIGCAAVGLALGLLAVGFEARGERFSLLVHRPMARSRIFAAKVLAAAVLYLFATAVPFLIASWWAATPGHIPAPFAGFMMLPGVVDISLGFAYYFAGYLTGIREARWYGSRGVGIAVAALCSCLVFLVPFGIAVLIAVTGIAVLGIAAWGSFVTGGTFRTQPIVPRIALSVCMLTGLGFVVVFVSSGIYEVARELHWTSPPWVEVAAPGRHVILPDGTVLADGSRPDDRARVEFVDLLGERVSYDENYRWTPRFVELHGFYGRNWIFDSVEGVIYQYDAPAPSMTDRRVVFAGYVDPSTLEPRLEMPARRLEFRGSSTPHHWRSWGSLWPCESRLLVFSDVVYECGYWNERVLLDASGGDRFIAARLLSGEDGQPPFGHAVVVSEESVVVVDATGGVILRTPMLPDRQRVLRVGLAALEGDRYAVYFAARADQHGVAAPEEVIRILSASSEIEEEHRLAPQRSLFRTYPRPSDFAGPGLPIAALVFASIAERNDDDLRPSALLERWYLYVGFAMASTLATFIITRCFAFSAARTWFWTGTAFVFGPVGLFALLSLEEWPARERCDVCGRHRIVTRATCESCGAERPRSQPDGTEIFDAA